MGNFWLIGTAFALRNFLTLTTLGGCTRVFREIRDLLVFGAWGTWRNFATPFGAQTGPKTPKRRFSRSWGALWAKRPLTKFDRMLNADPVNPVWGPMCPWGPRYGRFFFGGGGLGAISSVGDRFCGLGTQPTKRFGPEKNRTRMLIFFSVAVPTSLFLSKTERFWPLVPPIGAVRTEKT